METQIVFKVICKAHNANKMGFIFVVFINTKRYADVAIKTYKIVQTGPNNQLGGEKAGARSVLYQVESIFQIKALLVATNVHE